MNKEQREQFLEQSKGLTIYSIEYDEEEKYYVINFTNGAELCVRLMAEQSDI